MLKRSGCASEPGKANSVSKLVERVEHPRKLQNSNMRGRKKEEGEEEDSSSTTDDEEEDENDNSKSGVMISSKKPRKDSGIHSMNSSSSTVASDKDIGASRYVQNSSSNLGHLSYSLAGLQSLGDKHILL